MYRISIFLFFIFLFAACKEKPKEQQLVAETEVVFPVTIDLDDLDAEREPLKLSDIATGIEYIPLNSDSIVDRITSFQVADSFIFIEQAGRISSYMQSGRFVKTFPPNGRGPGEDYARCMAINEKDKIVYVFGNYTYKIIPFSYEGKWLKTSIPNKFQENTHALYAYGKNLFSITACLEILKDKSFSLGMNTEDGSIVYKYQNPYIPSDFQKVIRSRGSIYGFQLVTYQNFQDSLVLFRDQYNDTVYQTVDFKTISPRYIFHSDKTRSSYMDDLNAMHGINMDKLKIGYTLEKVLETSSFLFFKITTYYGNKFGVYEKANRTVRLFEKMTIQNDMDGGPDFTPYCDRSSQWVYKDKLYNLILPMSLLEHKSETPRSEAVEKLYQNVNEDDNPILMIVTLK